MSKIAFFAPVYRGHIVATESLVEALNKRGHEVIYYAPLQYQELIQNMNVEYKQYPNIPSLEYLMVTKLPPTDLHARLLRLTEGAVNAAKDLIPLIIEDCTKESVDLIIYDNMAIWGHVIAKKLSIPSICSTTVMAINNETIINTGEGAVYTNLPEFIEEPFHRLQELYPSDISTLVDLISGQYSSDIILYTSCYLQRHSQYFNKNKYIFFPARYLGEELPANNSISDLKQPTIYVSFGTLYNHDLDRFIKILNAFEGTEYKVTLSTGGEEEVYNSLLKYNTNPNISINLMLNQTTILKNTDIFITHGGFNSVQESIYHLVPMIVMPIAGDQNFIAKRLVELNAAKTVDSNLPIEQQISGLVNDIVKDWDDHQASLLAIRDSLSDVQNMEEALLRIEEKIYNNSYKDEL
ncbi:macrolide glycosyltransferase [endosymbiont of Acanthamoeba sp. UWC8]|uniref:glycosyltransferase n=1 Tax=endosymbiont of Acanthamoeba sp. UWC8 TaxID=86106 RepID=UPI0004D11B51|nr:glycosyltransferase [endosymbiont of Acanthamoeba sp. UWC8]AIF80975.1 macrolide glycosyltransferase [endosymbiont of Acanthamoeba sp. UWC8]